METKARNLIYYGVSDALPAVTRLQAGQMSLEFVSGALHNIYFGKYLVISRIYFAVRDKNWATVPYQINNLEIKQAPDSFQISYLAYSEETTIPLDWEVRIRSDPPGRLGFEVAGVAGQECTFSRAGLRSLASCPRMCWRCLSDRAHRPGN